MYDTYKDNNNFYDLKNFFSYFDLTWRKKNDLNDWNLYDISKKAIETGNLDKLFFTNNIMESCNAKLNDSIIKDKNNTVNNFNNKINYIINLYKTSKNYKHPIFSKTKALATYFTNNDFFENFHIINGLELVKKNIY